MIAKAGRRCRVSRRVGYNSDRVNNKSWRYGGSHEFIQREVNGWQRVEEDIATFAVSISLVESLSVRKEDDKVFNNLLKKKRG